MPIATYHTDQFSIKNPSHFKRRPLNLQKGTLIKRALEEPIRQIATNAGFEGSFVVQKVMEGKGNFGFNAETGEYEDLLKAGIIDPTKVTRFALQNAASVASLLMTTEAMVAEIPEKKKGPAMPDMPPEAMY